MDASTLLLGRLLSLGIAGMFAFLLVRLPSSGTISYYLDANRFGPVVLAGGVLLAVAVGLRAYRLWQTAGAAHDHSHEHDHGHDHSHDDHAHDVSLLRLLVLLFPLMMLQMGLVPQQFTMAALLNRRSADQKALDNVTIAGLPEGRSATGKLKDATLSELETASKDEGLRDYWTDKKNPRVARTIGQFIKQPAADRFQIIRASMKCCAQDAQPIPVLVVGKPDPGWRTEDWVEVVGPVDFTKVEAKGGARFFPIIYMTDGGKLARAPDQIYMQ